MMPENATGTGLTPDQLEPGLRYRVTFDDCCAQGYFVSRFVQIRFDAVETDFADALVFDTGEISPVNWGQWQITAEPEDDAPGDRAKVGERIAHAQNAVWNGQLEQDEGKP